MSYSDPTKQDLEAIKQFYTELADPSSEVSNAEMQLDLVRGDFDMYLNPEEYAEEWSRPYPRISREEFRTLSKSSREELIKEKAKEAIQDTMETVAMRAHIHSIEIPSVSELKQDPEVVRKEIQSTRTESQGKICDYK